MSLEPKENPKFYSTMSAKPTSINPLSNMAVMFAIDVSASMYTRDMNGRTRFEAVQEGAISLASKMLSVATDGSLSLYVFGRGAYCVAPRIEDPSDVAALFEARFAHSLDARTDTHDLIHLADADRDLSRNTLLIIATDGVPSLPHSTRQAIVDAAERCTPSIRDPGDTDDFTILFYQVGHDKEAKEYLRELDDDLVARFGAKFDIVDAKSADDLDGKDPFEIALEALED